MLRYSGRSRLPGFVNPVTIAAFNTKILAGGRILLGVSENTVLYFTNNYFLLNHVVTDYSLRVLRDSGVFHLIQNCKAALIKDISLLPEPGLIAPYMPTVIWRPRHFESGDYIGGEFHGDIYYHAG